MPSKCYPRIRIVYYPKTMTFVILKELNEAEAEIITGVKPQREWWLSENAWRAILLHIHQEVIIKINEAITRVACEDSGSEGDTA